MTCLFVTRDDSPETTATRLDEAVRQIGRHGFAAATPLAIPGWRILHAPYLSGGPEMLLTQGEDMVAAAGTLTFDGRMGQPALAALLESMTVAPSGPPQVEWPRLGGHFAALVRKNGRAFLLTDYLAAYQLFHDEALTSFSSSLLAMTGALPRLHFDPQGVYEFAFNVMPIGDDSLFSEIKTLGPDRIIELTPAGAVAHPVTRPLPTHAATQPVGERIARHRAVLETVVAPYAAHYRDHIHCPLSGGLDSRLVLAMLRAAGTAPHVYVYGAPDDTDVVIARAIGEALGFPVEWTDKEAKPLDPDQFVAQVERNFELFDATPTFGNIFDNGGHAAARDARHAGGALAASGGCGEVFRDFFYLPDRPTSAATVVSSFFARFTRRDTTALFDPHAFLSRMEQKVAAALDLPDARTRVDRVWIEQAYPRVRCRALFGREISLESRYGAYLMPFLDHRLVAEAMTLPMHLKQTGRFEAMLMAAIDPELAAQPSAYGHDFTQPPSRRHRFEEWSSRHRPVWLRRNSYAIQRRLRPMSDEHGGLLDPAYMGQVIDPAFPAMRRFFDMDAITDSGLWRRIACLEYLASRLGSKLAEQPASISAPRSA